jgi:hypothetical protein
MAQQPTKSPLRSSVRHNSPIERGANFAIVRAAIAAEHNDKLSGDIGYPVCPEEHVPASAKSNTAEPMGT